MKTITKMALALSVAAAPAWAQNVEDNFMINDEIEITVKAEAHPAIEGLSTVYSGWAFREDGTRVMQMDDFDNPGLIGVDNARDDWSTVEGEAGESCESCHGAPEEAMAGVRATYPKWNEGAGEVRTLEMQINACRTENMKAEAWGYNSGDMIDMTALISYVGRGETINVAIDGPAEEMWKQGEEMYYTRFGQLEMACANCHEDNYGNMIRADHLSQGQINGFPAYRLKNTKLNGVHNRFKGCIRDTMAHTFSEGSPEFVALELYVASRGNGLSVEGPAVRN